MRLLCSPASPYSAKVRLAAAHCDIAVEDVATDTGEPAADFLSANPLGKIPTLVLEDGTGIYDSRVICEYLDRMSGNLLIPQGDAEWLRAKRVEALADGIVDAAILVVYEARFRPEEKRFSGWTDRQWAKAERGLDALEAEVARLPEALDIGHFAIAGLLGWMDLRFKGQWDEGRPALKAWFAEFPTRFPAYAQIGPRG
ncbi:glutathione S-transferase family protein [Aureimonas mangrovi]|uniref:glutathione S-transferase family protein n=1 Tax=Aureimonas mangrovi TaxID=2758041 RepID=UPI00163DBEA8|nr:glutathione S-transferase [Aureimonas mangrovi]